MEVLKKILRLAFSEQATRVKLKAGKPVELYTVEGPRQVAAEVTIDQEYLQRLYAFLFPNDKAALAAGQTVRGLLSVPNVGKIPLIAQPSPPATLRLYLPPGGQSLFESDWQRLSSRTVEGTGATGSGVAPSPQPAPQPPLAAPATAAPGAFIPRVIGAPARGVEMPSRPPLAPPEAGGILDAGFPGTALTAQPPLAQPALANLPPPPPAFPEPDYGTGAFLSPAAKAPEPAQPLITFGPDTGDDAGISDGQNAIDQVLVDMIKRKASDVHITCGERLCLRVDGEIVRVGPGPLTPELIEAYILPIMPGRNQAEFAKINDTDFAYEIRNVGRFRVNVFRDRNGVGSVMRHIPSTILTAEQLALPPAITRFCQLTKGLVLVTGPTGSGKSTTLAAMIDLINRSRGDHILTIEDPVEFVHQQQKCLVNQREVHKHTGSFARALKAALREDPDIVLIGEMRDLETVAIAIETAETGHLVFGTLHTNTAVSTIDRIVDQFPTDRQEQIRMMLASSLKGVVAQTLLKKNGGGRVAAHEILVTNDAVSAMIREGKNHMIGNHMQSAKADGNLLLTDSLLKLVRDNTIEAEDALRKAVDKGSLIEAFKRSGIKVPHEARPHTNTKQSA